GRHSLTGRTPFVTTIHDVMPFYLWSANPVRYTFLRWCITVSARRSTRVIVTYQFAKDYLVRHLGIPEERVRVVPIGVDPRDLGVPNKPIAPVERKPEDLLFLGSWNPWARGGDLVLRAMPEVLSAFPKARLWFAGQSAETENMRALARKLGIEKSVEFCGFLSEQALGEKLRSVGALVYPSRIGFSLSIMQAMHVGTPVVVNDWLDMPEFVGNSGIVVPRDSVPELASGIVRLLSSPSLARVLVERGRRRGGDFSGEHMVEGTLAIYAEAAGIQE
ncbi:MAG: glycosyltransferase family 4 protein, partial [Candidatus Thermoplasmatota archaeon]|nr:glycosyltransferase family 4 protein [Candidatus Thermoplasmatota archaeon]